MPQIILGPGLDKIDGSLQKATYAFLAKLTKSDQTAGLHIEPINNSVDPRARTGRVDLSNRAVLFKLQGSNQDASYVFAGTYPHDEAIAIAQKTRVNINPRNGVAELIPIDENSVHPPTPAPDLATETPRPIPRTPSEEPGSHTLRGREFAVSDFTDLGIDADFAAGALDISNADDLLEYCEHAPSTWQGSALLDIYTGESLTDVRAKYGLDQPSESDGATEDDRILAALRHPAAQMEFAFIEDDDELRAAIENPSFAAWRVFLHPEQRRFVDGDYNGPFRLKGGAGTGKTVVLLHRARELYRRDPSSRIVLTTFNRTLADSLKAQIELLDPSLPIVDDLGVPGIYIAGIDSIAHRVLSSKRDDLTDREGQPGPVTAVLGARTSQIMTPAREDTWRNAADLSGADLPPELRTSSFLEAEYATVVLPERITKESEYLRVRRPGRGVALNRGRRKAVWSVISAYRAAAAADGTTDFEEKAAIAAEVLTGTGPLADHVLVDEAQDLSPSRFQLLRALATVGKNDLFIAEDGHQRIYGQQLVLSRYGINIRGRARTLTLNYRTTEQNLRYALGILAGSDYTDTEGQAETTHAYRSARSGPEPVVVQADSSTEEYERIAEILRGWLDDDTDPTTIGLLVPTKKAGEQLVRAMGDREVKLAFVDRDSGGKAGAPQVMTMHRSKGMEFAKVILAGAGASGLPRRYIIEALPEGDREDAMQRERSLLYVAATRARDQLVVTWSGSPSQLIPTRSS